MTFVSFFKEFVLLMRTCFNYTFVMFSNIITHYFYHYFSKKNYNKQG